MCKWTSLQHTQGAKKTLSSCYRLQMYVTLKQVFTFNNSCYADNQCHISFFLIAERTLEFLSSSPDVSQELHNLKKSQNISKCLVSKTQMLTKLLCRAVRGVGKEVLTEGKRQLCLIARSPFM